MNITLGQIGQTVYDITGRLDYETDIQLNQELERQAFQRTVEDVRLRCGNLNGFFTTLFDGMPPTARWEVVIRDARILFRGEIDNETITFDVNKEWVEFDIFSVTKVFWDAAKTTRIRKAVSEFGVDVSLGTTIELFITVEQLIKREVTLEKFGGIIAGYSISTLYAQRPVRFWVYTSSRIIGNNGRYRDLDPRTTIDELLKAMSIYYNAEFFVDPSTQFLVMQKRGAVLNDVKTNLNDVIEDDEKIDIQLFDEQKIDYLGLSLNLGVPSSPSLASTETETDSKKGLDAGRYKWAITNRFQSGGLVIESLIGQESAYDLPVSRSGGRYRVTLNVPLGPASCTSRGVYRTRNSGYGGLFFVGILQDNVSTTFIDSIPNSELSQKAPEDGPSGTIWIRYDEESGTWDPAIIGDPAGLNQPQGKIFEVTPKLRFLSRPFGNAFEIGAIYALEGKTRINTTEPHNFSKGTSVRISDTNTVPMLNGVQVVDEVFEDGKTFSIEGPAVTTGGLGGTVMRLIDEEKKNPLDTAQDNLFDVFAFFGNETSIDVFKTQWEDLFYTKRKGFLGVRGIDYRFGDSIVLNRNFNGLKFGNGVIKKASNNLSRERTELEIISS